MDNYDKYLKIAGNVHLAYYVQAADKLGISYRKAWGMIKETEEKLGFCLTEKHRGGQHGGNSVLTKEGKEMIEAYKDLLVEFDEAIYQITKKFFNKVNK